MPKDFVMRGKTASGQTEVLNFSGFKPGYAYKLTEFVLYPSTNIFAQAYEMAGTVTAGKTAVSPPDPDYNNEGLIATCFIKANAGGSDPVVNTLTIVNDTYLITQNLQLMVQDAQGTDVNWQCRFEAVKMNKAEEAVTNYKQFLISDDG